MWRFLANYLDPQALGLPRSPKWMPVRKQHLLLHPTCAACAVKINLNVHHIKPFWKFRELELDPGNLITLCESKSHNCHLIWGHFLDWQRWNPNVVVDSDRYLNGLLIASQQHDNILALP